MTYQVSIIDVISLDRCVCKTEDGILLEGPDRRCYRHVSSHTIVFDVDVPQKVLETIVPRQTNAVVSIVEGKYKGHVRETRSFFVYEYYAFFSLSRAARESRRTRQGEMPRSSPTPSQSEQSRSFGISEYIGDLDLEDDY